jgi:putative ABC transport system ATP-binding protein
MSDEESARLRRRRIGYVLQSFNLMPLLTSAQNVAMPLLLDNVARREIDTRVQAALTLVDIAHRAEHRPAELSGGEQQRVAIARALVIEPAIILADEPTGNLDRTSGAAVMELMQDVNERLGVTVLMVTHDPVFASDAQRVLRLVDGTFAQATDLTESGTPQRRAT